MGQSKRIRVNEDGEREKRCSRCGEWWPADKAFFYGGNGPGGLHCWCKACYKDAHNSRRRKGRIKKIDGRLYKVRCPNTVDIIREEVKKHPNLYSEGDFRNGFEEARQSILKALGGAK